MDNRPTPWREIACPTCNATVMQLHRRGDAITADYRTSGKGFLKPGQDPSTVHHAWFRGIDVAEELSDCADSLMDCECNCRTNRLPLRQYLDRCSNSPRRRVLLDVG